MFGLRAVVRMCLALVLAVPMAAAVGCGSGQGDVKRANVKPGDMPAGGEWTGVYYSPTYGHLHLIKEGDAISGKWRTAAGDKWGELHGEVDGNLLRYEWKERTIGMVGPTAVKTGKGYFKYVAPDDPNADHEIHGEWGLGGSDAGHTWTAVKQRNQRPDPDSVMPDETQKVQSEGWDEGGGGGGEAEEGADEEDDDEWD